MSENKEQYSSLIHALMATFTAQVAEAVKQSMANDVQAAAQGAVALDPEAFANTVHHLVMANDNVRDELRELIEDYLSNNDYVTKEHVRDIAEDAISNIDVRDLDGIARAIQDEMPDMDDIEGDIRSLKDDVRDHDDRLDALEGGESGISVREISREEISAFMDSGAFDDKVKASIINFFKSLGE